MVENSSSAHRMIDKNMKRIIILIAIIMPSPICAQDFEFVREWDTIPLTFEGHSITAPWLGGYYRSSPEAFDFNNDSDYDILVGGSGFQLQYFENIGNPTMSQFYYADEQLLDTISFDYTYTYPSVCDIDSDGDGDLFALRSEGASVITFFENIGSISQPEFIVAGDTLRDENGEWIWGGNMDWVDIDADGDLDFFDGRYNGELRFYENVGDSTQFSLRLITLYFEGIDFGYQGYPSPCFCDIDDDGDSDLFVGYQQGKIYFYENIGTPQGVDLADPVTYWSGIDVGDYSSPEFCDIDEDGDFDLFIGKSNDPAITPAGDLHFWRNIGTPQNYNFVEENQMYLTFDAGGTADVQLIDVEGDGDGDMYFEAQILGWMRNIGSADDPSFEVMDMNLINLGAVTFGMCDLDNDGDHDIVTSGGWNVVTKYYENRGTSLNPFFVYQGIIIPPDTVGSPTFADMDSDGDYDMLMGHFNWTTGDSAHLWYYENQGTPEQFNFVLVDQNYAGVVTGPGLAIDLVDFDLDGDYDLLVAPTVSPSLPTYGTTYYYQNCGTPQIANFFSSGSFSINPYEPLGAGFYDIDNDQDIDIFAGQLSGGIVFFRNVTGEPAVPPVRRHPQAGLLLSLGPNPANPVTWVTFHLPAPQKATLAVYNLLGQKVATLAKGLQPPGTNTYLWNAAGFASGVYVIQLETPSHLLAQQIVVLK